jgi:AhpD family alkylhydroperoxidase
MRLALVRQKYKVSVFPPQFVFHMLATILLRSSRTSPFRYHLTGHQLHQFTILTTRKMRVPYAPKEPPNPSDEPIYARIAARRAPRPLIPLDLALLHNTAVADGWNSFIGAIRTQTSLSPAVKELAVSRVAVLNSAVHEWDSHAALALKAGVSKEGMETVFTAEVCKKGDQVEEDGKGGLSKEQWIVIAYTDQMTRGVEVDDGVMEQLKGCFEDKEVVELTATVAAYNCVSRFLVALDVGERNGKAMKKVEEF